MREISASSVGSTRSSASSSSTSLPRRANAEAALARGLHGGAVPLPAAHLRPVLLAVCDPRKDAAGAQQTLGGDAGVVQAPPPALVRPDPRGFFPQLRRGDRRHVPAGTGAD